MVVPRRSTRGVPLRSAVACSGVASTPAVAPSLRITGSPVEPPRRCTALLQPPLLAVPVNTAADMVVPCLGGADVVGEIEGEACLDGSPHVTGGGKGLRASGGVLKPLVRGRVADGENIRLGAS